MVNAKSIQFPLFILEAFSVQQALSCISYKHYKHPLRRVLVFSADAERDQKTKNNVPQWFLGFYANSIAVDKGAGDDLL